MPALCCEGQAGESGDYYDGRREITLKITIEGEPKEISALVLAVQERQNERFAPKTSDGLWGNVGQTGCTPKDFSQSISIDLQTANHKMASEFGR